MNLAGQNITELPDNLTVNGSISLSDTNIDKLPNNLIVKGSLFASYTYITEIPYSLKVENSIFLDHTPITELPYNLTVGGYLNLTDTSIAVLPDNLTVSNSLNISNTKVVKLPDSLRFGWGLILNDTKFTELPDNLTIPGRLVLNDSNIKELPSNLTVGECLEIRGLNLSSLPDNLTVGGYIYYSDLKEKVLSKVNKIFSPEQHKKIHDLQNMALFWERNGVSYIKVNGIFSVIDSHHGNVYKVHELGKEVKPFYFMTDGDNHWVHGETIREAKAQLIYKLSDKDASRYKKLSLNDTLSYEEAIVAYRIITNSLDIWVRDFVKNSIPFSRKNKYTIKKL